MLEAILRRARELAAAQSGLNREQLRELLAAEFSTNVEEALDVLFPPPQVEVVLMDLDHQQPASTTSPTLHARPRPAGSTKHRMPALAP